MAEPKPYKGGYYLWRYVPSLPLAIIFGIVFLVATVAHGWRLHRTRLWFCIPLVVGGIMEVAGYFARAKASSATDRLMPYVIQNIFILLPPILFAASIYMTLGRLMRAVGGEKYSLVPVQWLTKIFVGGDVVSFMVQGAASGLMATGNNMELGQWIVVAGLLTQIAIFGFFIVTALVFHRRVRTASPTATCSWYNVRWVLYMLYAVSALIMVRSVFRVIEFVMGHNGYPLSHEWTLYVFDSVPMLAVMGIYCIWYPSWADITRPPPSARISSEDIVSNPEVHFNKKGNEQV